MSSRHLVLILLVVVVWGANFTVIKVGLADVPPMLLAALRFAVVAFPAVFVVPRPNVPGKYWIAYGLAVGVGQFGALFYAMDMGVPAGVASVVMQSQAFFTIPLAALWLNERVLPVQLTGMAVAALGLSVIGSDSGHPATLDIPVAGLFLCLAGAACWGVANIVVRLASASAASRGDRLDMLGLIVWSSLVPPVPLLGLALLLHGSDGIMNALEGFGWRAVLAVGFLAFGATLFGFGVWSKLLSMYPASRVAPFSLLVPVTGVLTARIALGEQLTRGQWFGSALVVLGLIIATSSLARRPGARRPALAVSGARASARR
ncbi:MAG: EamA family transporter [Firmicutes bacterium]|nr:EamA family transporter [Bacillota bacterium]